MDNTDISLEAAVVGCLLQHCSDAYFTVCDKLDTDTFSDPGTSTLFSVLSELYEGNVEAIDMPTLLSSLRSKNLLMFADESDILSYKSSACSLPNLVRNASKLRKLQILRVIKEQLKCRTSQVDDFSGEENLAEILQLLEIDYSSLLKESKDIVRLGEAAEDIINEAINNPVDQIGISTGFKKYDAAIGGGLRGGSLNIIGARMKQGKSLISMNMAMHICRLDIPVLYVDTEMRSEEQIFRCIASMSNIPMKSIETGKCAQRNVSMLKIDRAMEEFKELSFYHVSVAGMEFEQHMGLISRWMRQTVGQDLNGNWNPCVIIYDYIKMTSSTDLTKNLAEHQALGFMATQLHNTAVRYDIPIIGLVQLNRDGIDKGGTGVVAGSDRILRLCTSFAILKPKSREEIDAHGEANGNKKLVVELARHGPGMGDGDYINIAMWGDVGRVLELDTTASELTNAGYQKA